MGKAHYESGGIAIARAIRQAYIDNPNHCLTCGKAILPKEGRKLAETKKKKFCSQKCNYDSRAPLKPNRKRRFNPCVSCGENTNIQQNRVARKFCPTCWENKKKEILLTQKQNSTHAKIRSHARSTVGLSDDEGCWVCGYSKHIEVCHVRPVNDFLLTDTLAVINHPSNLAILCRNHHWEFDNDEMPEYDLKKVFDKLKRHTV